MARVLSQTLIRNVSASSSPTFIYGNSSPSLGLSSSSSSSARILTHRHRSNQSGKAQLIEVDLESSDADVEVLGGIRKLEDVIHNIIVKRSAPDWLPFIPGSSYWVPPPRRRPYGVVEVLGGKFPNPLTHDESMSLTSVRGWPSSAFFIKGTSSTHPIPMEVEVEVMVHDDSENASRSEDEEG